MGSSKVRSDGFRRIGGCLYRYERSRTYFAFFRHQGKLSRTSLETTNLAQAKRKLLDLRAKKERVATKSGKVTLNSLCADYLASLKLAPKTLQGKETIRGRIESDWPHLQRGEVQIHQIKPIDIRKWLNSYDFGAATYNSYLWFIRSAFEFAIENKWLAENPAEKIGAQTRDAPIRLTPTFDQFKAIVKEVRSQIQKCPSSGKRGFY
ncbi:MAG: hypothetical protein AAGA96_01275 [Verrucomicrobiota bacterium]